MFSINSACAAIICFLVVFILTDIILHPPLKSVAVKLEYSEMLLYFSGAVLRYAPKGAYLNTALLRCTLNYLGVKMFVTYRPYLVIQKQTNCNEIY